MVGVLDLENKREKEKTRMNLSSGYEPSLAQEQYAELVLPTQKIPLSSNNTLRQSLKRVLVS